MSISGVSYQQANQVYQNTQQAKTENQKETGKTASKSDKVKVSEWKPVSEGSSLAPTTKADTELLSEMWSCRTKQNLIMTS